MVLSPGSPQLSFGKLCEKRNDRHSPSRSWVVTFKRGAQHETIILSLRAKGRSEQVAFRVRPEVRDRLYELAETRGMTMTEVLEEAILEYDS